MPNWRMEKRGWGRFPRTHPHHLFYWSPWMVNPHLLFSRRQQTSRSVMSTTECVQGLLCATTSFMPLKRQCGTPIKDFPSYTQPTLALPTEVKNEFFLFFILSYAIAKDNQIELTYVFETVWLYLIINWLKKMK